MALGLGAADRQFQEEAQAFIARHWRRPADERPAAARPWPTPVVRAWFDALLARGWSVPHWPVEHGGTGWPAARLYLWARELALAEAPLLDPIGLDWAGPAICAWGTRAQQECYLPGIREGRERWCLGFAGPEAGSDLDRLRTRARREASGPEAPARARADSADCLVDGLESWVPGAAAARWMLALVRSGAASAIEIAAADAAQSLVIVDMTAPGVTVEPLRLLDGTTGVCRVRLRQVRVPAMQQLGRQGSGRRLAQALAARTAWRFEPAAALRVLADKLQTAAAELPGDAGPLADDPGFARKLADLGVDLAGLEALEARYVGVWEHRSDRDRSGAPRAGNRDREIAAIAEGRDREIAPGPESRDRELASAVLQLRRTRIAQRIGELFVEAFGYYSLPYPEPRTVDNEGPIGHDYAFAALQGMLAGRALSIDGGSSESLRDRIANQLAGH